ncbi:hypothetical protein ALC152_15840 [Arcobacter sp. 15-2]|uniref:FecR domain-containing protein n=1 Tax=Arcobacter sp. 15-2 TaxID=3374109 RepID=UPI00399CC898
MKIILLSLLLFVSTLFGNVGKITALSGDVSLTRDSKNIVAKIGTIINEKDLISTAKNARAQIVFTDKTIISLGKNSTFDVEEYFFDEQKPAKTKASFKVAKGVFKSITGRIGKINPSKFKLKTKSASIGIRGTVFFGEIADGKPDTIACTSGAIVVETPDGIVEVLAGQLTSVEIGKAPTPPATIPPAKAKKLEQSSGADKNQQDSGEGQGTAPTKAPASKPSIAVPNALSEAVGTAKDAKNSKEDSKKQDETLKNADSDSTNSGIDTPDPDNTDGNTPDPNNPDNTGGNTPNPDTTTKNYKVWGSSSYRNNQGLTINPNNGEAYYGAIENQNGISYSFAKMENGFYSAKIKLYSFNPDGTRKNNPSSTIKTIPSFELTSSTNTYNGFSRIYTYSNPIYTSLAGDEVTLNENIYVDSLQEFFIYSKSYDEINVDYEFRQKSVMGIASVFDELPTDGIDLYIDPEIADSSYESDQVFLAPTAINWKNKNLLSYEIYNGGLYIGIGKISKNNIDGTADLDFNFYETKNDFSEKLTSTNSDMKIFGSEHQGWGGTIFVQDSAGDKSQMTHGEYKIASNYTNSNLENLKMPNIENRTSTGQTTLKGFAVGNSDINTIELTINRTNTISGSITNTNNEYINIQFNGLLGQNAGYITDDYFATLGFSGKINSQASNIDDGWLIALDSGNVGDATVDDGISWGLWGIDADGAGVSNDVITSAWVAAQDLVQDISSLANTGVVSYAGQALGTITDMNNNLTTLIDPTISTMNLSFDFDTGDLTASLNANDGDFVHSITGSSDILNNNSSVYTMSGENQSVMGSITGSFYKEGAVTIGSFDFEEIGTYRKAVGVYKAAK